MPRPAGRDGGEPREMLAGFADRGPPATEGEITAFERRCGFRLPPDYRAFLAAQNGGVRGSGPRDEGTDGDWTGRPRRFFSLGVAAAAGLSPGEALDLAAEARTPADFEALAEMPELTADLDVRMRLCRGDGSPGYYPPHLLPIAVGDHDDLLLLALDGPDAGAVLYTFDPDGYCEWHCHRLAGSFAEFLRVLNSPEP